jgi:uncharacterized protein YigE (DUF2233 family)
MRLPMTLAGAMLLAACTPEPKAAAPVHAVPAGPCTADSFEGSDFTHCVADPARHRITTALDAPDGDPARSLAVLKDMLPAAANVAFAMNGGMFDDAGEPIGYYVEAGERRHKLNRVAGGGNFGLLPNGVFYGTGSDWHVATADDFAARVHKRPQFATQSGPMLVIAGKLHPKFARDGESLHIRNGVGIDRAGRAHFVITGQAVSFGKLARYFRDRLKTPDALYLDGSVSALWDPASGRLDRTAPLGPLIVVEKAGKGRR